MQQYNILLYFFFMFIILIFSKNLVVKIILLFDILYPKGTTARYRAILEFDTYTPTL